ncbi:MAG: BMP family ABC transporter substrate-binding protein [Alphaproteobacteria bacterium]|nr:MAG: BMP family ABC transporter substrate-binding protein [Alphaproteobacteria bacterium]
MKRLMIAAAVVALTLGSALTGATAQEKLKVGFIYVGPVGDMGWTYQHEVGRRAIQEQFKDKIDTSYLENVNEGPDAERSIEQLVRTGHKLIYTTSFGFMDATAKVAKKYPNVMFEHATGYKRDKNLATYSGRFYEGRYIMGQIAARMSKSGTIGYIGSFPIPEVVSGVNAMMLGAQSVRPDMKVKIIWVNAWYDPGKEAAAARALADQGADVLAQHTDSAAAMQFANERGIFAFGQDSDQIKFGPKAQLTAIVNNWTPYYAERIKLALEGKWATGDVWGGLNSKIVQMAPYTNMPDEVKKLATETEGAISSGTLHPFKCPVLAQDGKPVECKGGTHLDDGQILGMNFYIKGIDDKLPGM